MQAYALKPIKKVIRTLFLGATLATFNYASINHALADTTVSSKKTYNIQPGPLAKVLSEFAAESGILLSANAVLADGKTSKGLQGSYTIETGFAALLSGTSLVASKHANGSYTILRKGADEPQKTPEMLSEIDELPEIKVQTAKDAPNAYAGGMIARKNRLGMLGDVDVKDAPFHVTGFTAEAIANRQANTVADVVARDPSVRSTAPSGDAVSYTHLDVYKRQGIYRAQNGGKVYMTTKAEAHQGLGVAQYAWCTSPLRRAVDLINQRQLISVLTMQPPVYPANGDEIVGHMRNFDQTYNAYNEFQTRMERYWCLQYLVQEHITDINATVWRENLVRLESLPYMTKVHSLPAMKPGSKVRLAVQKVDTLLMELECKFLQVIEEVIQEATPETSEAGSNPDALAESA